MERGRSPKRAHILASINPFQGDISGERLARRRKLSSPTRRLTNSTTSRQAADDAPKPPKSPNPAQAETEPTEHAADPTSPTSTTKKSSRFRFKSKKHASSRRDSITGELLNEKPPRRRARTRSRDRERERDDRDGSPSRRDGSPTADLQKDHHRHRSSRSHHHHHPRHSSHCSEHSRRCCRRSTKRRRLDGDERRHSKRHRAAENGKEEEEDDGEEEEAEDPFAEPPLDADAAFRESLFDAMADDEGAAYWEAVYGQPVHTYGPPSSATGGGGGGGPLDVLTDEEYAAHVRQRMWEKTHEGMLEARERRERLEREKRERAARKRRVDDEVERSLRRGEERRHARAWRARWDAYCAAWAKWEGGGGGGGGSGGGGGGGEEAMTLDEAGGDVWPVESGKRADISERRVAEFFVKCLDAEELEGDDDDGGRGDGMAKEKEKEKKKKKEGGFAARLKDERVRWHPDKMQQRLGGHVDETVMRDVTAIFQIVDKMWTETRQRKE